MMKKITLYSAALLAIICLVLAFNYAWVNTETHNIEDALLTEVPGQRIDLPLGATYYELAGPTDGDKVILVHGFSVPSYIWEPTFQRLSQEGFRVLRYDLYGRGFSDRPELANDPVLFAQQINDLRKAIDWNDTAHVVGLSMGGLVAGHYSANYAEHVSSLSLIDPVTAGRSSAGLMAWPIVGEWLMRTQYLPNAAAGQLSDFYDQSLFPNWPEKYYPQMQYKGFGRSILSTIRHLPAWDIENDYRGVADAKIPVQLFWGEEDTVLDIEQAKLQQQWNPGIEFHPIAKAGHLPHYEKPELVEPLLIDFLRRH